MLEKSDRNEESSSSSDSSFHIKDSDPLCDGSLTLMIQDVTAQTVDTPVVQPSLVEEPTAAAGDTVTDDIIVWEGSTAAKSLGCRGWLRSDDEWIRKTDLSLRKRNNNILRCADDPKFRTRLCNHWDVNQGTFCPMRRKGKCVFAHGPVELRVKEGKRNRWGKLVDENGDNSNPKHSGGEDTYGAARSIETVRKEEGKWNTNKTGKAKGRPQGGKKRNGSVKQARHSVDFLVLIYRRRRQCHDCKSHFIRVSLHEHLHHLASIPKQLLLCGIPMSNGTFFSAIKLVETPIDMH